MRVILFLIFLLTVYAKCPETWEDAFVDTVEVKKSLIECTIDELRQFYIDGGCCDEDNMSMRKCSVMYAAVFISAEDLGQVHFCDM